MLARKHIRAPRSFDPGPGLPRERLAYLSEAEMEALRLATDGTVNRGPRGIPSFAVTSGKESGTTMGGGEKTKDNPSGGGPGGPFGANSGPSTSSATKSASGSGGQGSGGSHPASGASPGSTASKSPASASSAPSASKAPSSSTPSKSPSAPSAGTPASPMGGQGTSFSSSAAASAANKAASLRSGAPTVSPMGGQGASFSKPAAAEAANKAVSSALGAGKNPSGSPVAGAMSKPQVDAYRDFGQRMASAPRQPEVTRTPGDADQLARMATAENGLIRDPYTGKMSTLASQATMDVVRNRMEKQKTDVEGVISQKSQFSPWGDGSYAATPPNPAQKAMAEAVLRGVTPDYTATPSVPQGADFYHNADTVKKDKGYQTASAATKARINDNFTGTLSVDDGLGGPWGHTYGVAADGSSPTVRGTSKMAEPRNGATSYGSGHVSTPASLPAGAMSQDPNYGGIGGEAPSLRQNIGYSPAQPAEDYGTIGMGFNVPRSVGYNSRFSQENEVQDPNHFSTDKVKTGFYGDRVGPNGESIRMDNWSNGFDPNKLNPQAQHLYDAMVDASLRTGTPRDYFSGRAGRDYNGDGVDDTFNHPSGNAIDSRVMDPATGAPVGGVYNPKGLTGANKAAYDRAANDVLDTMYQNPEMYGGLGPQTRYGGDFMSGKVPGDQMHMDVTPGGAFSNRQSARHDEAMARASTPGAISGFQTASAVNPGIINSAPPSQPYQLSEGGIYNAMKSLPGAISGLGRGFKSFSDAVSTPNPVAKGFLGAIGSGGSLGKGLATVGFNNTAAPGIKAAISSGIQSLKDTFDPNNPRAQQAPNYSGSMPTRAPTSGSVRNDQTSERRGERGASATKGGRKGEGKDGGREMIQPKRATVATSKGRVGRKRIEDLATPDATAPNPWDYFTNVITKEQALRQLLGEDWYKA